MRRNLRERDLTTLLICKSGSSGSRGSAVADFAHVETADFVHVGNGAERPSYGARFLPRELLDLGGDRGADTAARRLIQSIYPATRATHRSSRQTTRPATPALAGAQQ